MIEEMNGKAIVMDMFPNAWSNYYGGDYEWCIFMGVNGGANFNELLSYGQFTEEEAWESAAIVVKEWIK